MVKMLIVSLDCLDWKFLMRFRSHERVGFDVARMMCSVFSKTEHIHTFAQYMSFISGLYPDEHGFEYMDTKPLGDMDVSIFDCIWDRFESIGIFQLPMMFPPPRLKSGWAVTNTTWHKLMSYPEWVAEIADRGCPEERGSRGGVFVSRDKFEKMRSSKDPSVVADEEEEFVNLLAAKMRQWTRNLLDVYSRAPVDDVIFYQPFLDFAAHEVANEASLKLLYDLAFEQVDVIAKQLQPATLIVFGDHGCCNLDYRPALANPSFVRMKNGLTLLVPKEDKADVHVIWRTHSPYTTCLVKGSCSGRLSFVTDIIDLRNILVAIAKQRLSDEEKGRIKRKLRELGYI